MTTVPDKTILAFDYGTRRIGVAKSDSLGMIASAVTTIEAKSAREVWKRIESLIAEFKPARIVVGYPELASGDKSDKCREVDAFIEKLETYFGGPIHRVDESYSSVEAAAVIHAHGKQAGRDKKRIDRIAAVIILQRYLDEKHNG